MKVGIFLSLALATKVVFGQSPDSPADFLDAVRHGDQRVVSELLAISPTLIWRTDEEGQSALHVAAANGDHELVQFLLKRGADPHFMRRGSRVPPLLMALQHHEWSVASVLVEHGAKVNALAANEQPILHVVASEGNERAVKFLLDNGADVNQVEPQGHTALCRAVEAGRLDVVKTLVAHGADVNRKHANGRDVTVHLHTYRTQTRPFIMLQVLDQAGADVGLLVATYKGDTNAIRTILDKDTEALKRAEAAGHAPLSVALSSPTPRLKLIKLLVERGAKDASYSLAFRRDHFEYDPEEITSLPRAVLELALPHLLPRSLIKDGASTRSEFVARGRASQSSPVPGPTIRIGTVQLGLGGKVSVYAGDLFYEISNVGGKQRLEFEIDEREQSIHVIDYESTTQIALRKFNDGMQETSTYERDEDLKKADESAHELLRRGRQRAAPRTEGAAKTEFGGRFRIEGYAIIGGGNARTGVSPLARIYDTELLKKLLKTLPNVVNQTDRDGLTPLYHAAVDGRADVVNILLESGAFVDAAQPRSGITALHGAAETGNDKMVQLLLEKGAEVDVRDRLQRTPLRRAVEGGHVDSVKALLNAGADPYVQDAQSQNTLLAVAVAEGRLDIVKLLLSTHKNWADDGHRASAALGLAIESGQEEIAKFLVKAGVPTDGQLGQPPLSPEEMANESRVMERLDRRLSETSIFIDCALGRLKRVQALLTRYPELVNVGHPKLGCTPLMFSVVADDPDIAKVLLERGADPNEVRFDSDRFRFRSDLELRGVGQAQSFTRSAMHWATYMAHTATLETLIRYGGDIEAPAALERASDVVRPMHIAAAEGHIDVLELLKGHGAQVEGRSLTGETPLHYAARRDGADAVAWLLSHGAKPALRNSSGDTPLHVAARSKSESCTAKLLERDVDVDSVNDDGNAALHIAAEVGSVRITELLLSRSANVSRKNHDGLTPLNVATAHGWRDIARVLVEAGQPIDVNSAIVLGMNDALKKLLDEDSSLANQHGDSGRTLSPLRQAALSGNLEALNMLLNHGADVSTPLLNQVLSDAAIRMRPHEPNEAKERTQFLVTVIRTFVEHGADINAIDRSRQTPLDKAAFLPAEVRDTIEKLGGKRRFELREP